MKTVVLEKDRATRPIDEINAGRIYMCQFGCGDIAVATKMNVEPDLYIETPQNANANPEKWTFVSIISARNFRITWSKYDSLKELIENALERNEKVFEFANVRELAQFILDNVKED